MKNKKLFSLLFLFSILIGFMVSTNQANAVSYYNWVKNPSFEASTNLIEDNSFESGEFNSGLTYGNWSQTGGAYFSSSKSQTGVYSLYSDGTGDYLWYNFTDSVLGADIESFSFYSYVSMDSNIIFKIYYSDSSLSDESFNNGAENVWVFQNVSGYVNDAKYIIAFMVRNSGNAIYVDNFELYVYDPDSLESQSEITLTSSPWLWVSYPSIWQTSIYPDTQWDMPNGQITDAEYKSGSHSYEFIEDNLNNYHIGNLINFLDSNSVHYVDLYVKTNASSVVVKATILYSDGRYTSKNITVTPTEGWDYVNFGGNWIYSDIMIYALYIKVYDSGNNESVFVDDIGLWASVPAGIGRLTWYLAPTAQQYGFMWCSVYNNINYQFIGLLTDSNGELTENGTVTVTSTQMSKTATIINGAFTFVLGSRNYIQSTTERITLSFSLNSGGFAITIDIYWIISPSATDSGNLPNSNLSVTAFISLMILFIIIVAPSFAFAIYCGQHNVNPLFGFLGIFNVMAIICLVSGILGLWVLIIVIILDIVMGLVIWERKGI